MVIETVVLLFTKIRLPDVSTALVAVYGVGGGGGGAGGPAHVDSVYEPKP
jgi:hypothetical protein